MPGAAAKNIHQRAYAKYVAGQPLTMFEKVALQQIDLDASQSAGKPVTIDSYSGGANAQYKDIGNAVGGLAKLAAPIAALAIPGLGPLAAAGLAAGGEAAGDLLQGNRVNLGHAALAGGGAYVARGGLSGKAPVGSPGPAGFTPPNPGGLRGVDMVSPVAQAAGGAGRFLGKVGDYVLQHPGDIAKLGLGAVGAVQGAKAQGRANELVNRSLAPLNAGNPFEGIGSYGNPYDQPRQMSGRQSLIRELSR